MNDCDEVDLPLGVTCPRGGWTHQTVTDRLNQLLAAGATSVTRTTEGFSAEGRSIESLTLGAGKTRVIAWSQMHGDEHTYTSVVLNLLQMLIQAPASPITESILDNLSLLVIPLLNPDGAQRGIRFNAQGVDINRDARDRATPEGALLHRVVREFSPGYAFNLHNQSPRRLLPHSPDPIALSVLVPPVDPQNSQTPGVLEATRVVASVCHAVAGRCGSRLSRYTADYMPRCFGEWAQSQGVATVLLEAGGSRHGNIEELERLNFLALLAGLEAIAEPGNAAVDPSIYANLPHALEREAFDLFVSRPLLICGPGTKPVEADLGVNRPNKSAMPPCPGLGRIEDIGDLREYTGLATINAQGMLCLPGGIGIAEPPGVPDSVALERLQEEALGRGQTTLLVIVDGSSQAVRDGIRQVTKGPAPLIHVGFVACRASEASVGLGADWLLGALDNADPSIMSDTLSVEDFLSHTKDFASRFGLQEFHAIGRGELANLVLTPNTGDLQGLLPRPNAVAVDGTLVLSDGAIVQRHAGAWLRRASRAEAGPKSKA
ncbi:MAG: hypothetical protein KDA37_05795 [Planctomycetales bacterium]|nr:hypothetical protein [Planctomycetales bacterium]